jgi:enoyl-CoA hydratase/carnithine racemase
VAEVLLERPEDGIAVVRLNRPEARNGGHGFFAAGADLKDMAEASAVEVMLRETHLLWQAIAECPKPVIAAVDGYALGGGCELAMHADMIVAGEGASFGQPEIRVGIMPGAGGTQRLTRAVGKFKAMKMVLTGEPVGAREAEAMGLVTEVVPDGEVDTHALDLARKVARMPPLAVRQIKEVLLAGQDAPLSTALMLERKAFQLLFASEDQKEGMRAFLEKRRPAFKGR